MLLRPQCTIVSYRRYGTRLQNARGDLDRSGWCAGLVMGGPHPGTRRLGIDELDVCRAVEQQRFMGTRAHDSPAVDDDHLVGLEDGRDPLCDNDYSRIRGDLPRRRADQGVGVDIDGGERVVEQVNGRAPDHPARAGQSLPLSAGEVDAALGDPHLQPFWWAINESRSASHEVSRETASP